ncbi:MAG: DNA recombination protein RmuC [Bacteroidales bacterium]|jgi:DNA recombination protein RmuC|nr:DNA recombination protein RmuC [Bacteroidales bacterium]
MNIIILIVGAVVIGLLIALLLGNRKRGGTMLLEDIEQKYVLRSLYNEVKLEQTRTQEELSRKTGQVAGLMQKCEGLQEKITQSQAEFEVLKKQMQTEFENLANKILEEKSQKFVAVNEEKISGILKPLGEKIQHFEKKVEETYNAETREKTALRTELKQMLDASSKMTGEAERLTRALKGDSKVQGDWGEIQLEMLLDKAGLQKGVHYLMQENFKTEQGANVRPDFIINLPENKNYIIDCKVSLTAYERFVSAENNVERERALSEHLASLKRHIDELSNKSYYNLYGINPPDFVFLFVPVEPALHIALQNDLTLFDKAFSKNVVLLSPTMLLATLRTVTFMWRQETQKKNVMNIVKESGALYDKFVGFSDDLIRMGKKLDEAQGEYRGAMNKLTESSKKGDTIVGRIERIKELGAGADKSIDKRLLDRVGAESVEEDMAI